MSSKYPTCSVGESSISRYLSMSSNWYPATWAAGDKANPAGWLESESVVRKAGLSKTRQMSSYFPLSDLLKPSLCRPTETSRGDRQNHIVLDVSRFGVYHLRSGRNLCSKQAQHTCTPDERRRVSSLKGRRQLNEPLLLQLSQLAMLDRNVYTLVALKIPWMMDKDRAQMPCTSQWLKYEA